MISYDCLHKVVESYRQCQRWTISEFGSGWILKNKVERYWHINRVILSHYQLAPFIISLYDQDFSQSNATWICGFHWTLSGSQIGDVLGKHMASPCGASGVTEQWCHLIIGSEPLLGFPHYINHLFAFLPTITISPSLLWSLVSTQSFSSLEGMLVQPLC